MCFYLNFVPFMQLVNNILRAQNIIALANTKDQDLWESKELRQH